MVTSYQKNILKFREEKDAKIKSDNLHWLNLVGLFWLEEGDNSFGNDESNKIFHSSFPKSFCGNFALKNKQVTFHPEKGVMFSSDIPNPESRNIITDANNNPDMIHIGSLTMKVLVRGNGFLIRMWDEESEYKKKFDGLKYYPVKEEYKVPAKYIPYETPKHIKKVESLGNEVDAIWLGHVHFQFKGVDCSIEVEKSDKDLLLFFSDETSATTTYGGGRRIYLTPPTTTDFILDLNRTENWPCAYTDYATCPLVPKQNRLPIKIEAGELKYKD
jgi:uncharacterized protein (DUF1684 family)